MTITTTIETIIAHILDISLPVILMDLSRRPVITTAILAASTAIFAAITELKEREYQEKIHQRQRGYRPPLSYVAYTFQLGAINDVNCVQFFRFDSREIHRLTHHFELENVVYRERVSPSPTTALCVVLYRLSRPRSYADMTRLFGHSRT